jgi:NADPH:quinone reductase-like Zn-dependent oxidoreductase
MKAARIVNYGVIQTTESAEEPVLQPGTVLIEVAAAGMNPFDVKLSEGFYQESISLAMPAIPGGDVAGIVADVGEGVTDFSVGQEVYGSANAAGGHGSFAEFTIVKSGQLSGKPTTVDFVQAAALPLTATSAYQALVEHMSLKPGQKILIHGGAGGIGSFAIQIAKNIGAYVATTASVEDADFVKGLGADEVIDYKTQDFSQLVHDYDAVFDTVGGETNAKSYQVLKSGGTLVSMLVPPDEEKVNAKQLHYTQQSSRATQERLAKVSELVEADKLTVRIDKVFSLDEAAAAFEYLKTGHSRGKVVIKVKD